MKKGLLFLVFILMFSLCFGVGATTVYWTENYPSATNYYVSRIDSSGTPNQQLTSDPGGYEDVVTDTLNDKIYLANNYGNKIIKADLDGSNKQDLINSINPRGLAIDLVHGKLYWTDYTWGVAVIKRANLDGNSVQTLTPHLGNGCDLWGMDIDVSGGKIYWVERGDDVIVRANLDGSSRETILHCYDGVSNTKDVDVYNSHVYWIDGLSESISRADLNGDNVVNDIVDPVNDPVGMDIDQETGDIYWTSDSDNAVMRSEIDGSNIETVIAGITHPWGIDLYYHIIAYTEPSNHVNDFTANPQSTTQIDCSWTENDGDIIPDGYLIKAHTGEITDPVDGTDPEDDTNLTDGEGVIHISHGTSSYPFLNCSPSTTYNFKIYPYQNSGSSIDYKTMGDVPSDDATTYKSEPTNHVLDFTGSWTVNIDLTWTENDGAQIPDGYLIKASEGTITDPVDGVDPADDTNIMGSPGSGVVHIDHGVTEYSFTQFDELSSYDFKIYPYTNSGTLIDYKIDGAPSTTVVTMTIDPEPTNHVLDFTVTAMSEFQIDLTWTENDGEIIPEGYLIKGSTGAVSDPVDGTDPADDDNLGDGDGVVHVAYGSSSYTFWSANSSTTYNFKLYPYTNSGEYIDFKTDDPVPEDDATTPDAPILPEVGDLIITEVCGDNVDGVDDNDGFVEIKNVSSNLIDLSVLTVRYFDNGAEWPMETFLWGTLEADSFIVITQDIVAFEEQYGFWADFTEMMLPFDGGADGIEIYFMDMMPLIIDQFNETGVGSSPWSWNADHTYERDMCGEIGDGSLYSSWTENTTSVGTPGVAEGTSLGTPVISIEIIVADENIIMNLDWESVECADSYNIYSLEEPYGDFGDPIDNTTETFWSEIIGEMDDIKFYKVTAVN